MDTKAKAPKAAKELVIPTPKFLEDALALAGRFRDVQGLQRYAALYKPLLLGATAAIILLGLACGAGVFIFVAGSGGWLALPAIVLAPLVALGSLFVLLHVFFSWIENRALARALGHRAGPPPGKLERRLKRKLGIDLGTPPPVPWLPAALLVVLPLALLVLSSPFAGIAFVVLAVAIPPVYARLESRM